MKKLCFSQITSVSGGMKLLFWSKDEWVDNKKSKFTDEEPKVFVKNSDDPLEATKVESE